MTTDYEKHLIETIERQEREIVRCREWMDAMREICEEVRSKCGNMRFSAEDMKDVEAVFGMDMIDMMCDVVRKNGMEVLEEEIKKLRGKYGK